ncbi:unnamed protein product [Coregonus sp. 'balchen']|nr:unnamed protein product [Coregonus sp. 'balchen']
MASCLVQAAISDLIHLALEQPRPNPGEQSPMRLEAAARMDLIKKLWRARKLILVVLIPLSLLPLPLIHPTSEACCAYVLIVTAVYWVSEAVPLGAAALVPAFLYPLFGVLKSSETAISIPEPKKEKESKDSRYPTKRDHMICKCLSLSITYAATIGGLITITGTSTNLIFAEQFNNRYPDAKVINFGTWFIFSFPIAIIMLLLTWVWLHFLFLGCNFRETCSLSKKRKTRREMLSERRIHDEYIKLGPISYPEVVTGVFFILMTLLWFTREPGFVPGWTSLFEKKGYRTDATVSVLLGFLLFLIPARRPFSRAPSTPAGEGSSERDPDPLAPMITWKDFQNLMPWEIVILVGGGYALAAGCKVTEFASNPATLTVFLPILSALSETLQINPLHTLIPATMCVSFGVMLPVGNPPNAIVFSYGHVQISDMVKAGFGVNLIGVLVVMLAIMTWGVPLFNLTEFPDWAIARNVTGSL